MALVISAPQEARAQILRSAARQFEEGDVQHWWHPPADAGVRTRITDDLFFLPLAVHHYVTATGDLALLDERVPFLKSPVLRPDQEDDYNVPGVSEQMGSVYEHCVRALEHGYKLGPHGLPLMGTGDWNDGMNKVGAHGQGESVWNGWFFVTVLNAFAELADRRGDAAQAAWCRDRAEALRAALEANAWDGALVSPRLLRRRHAARLGPERRVPDRRHPAGLGGDLRRCRPGASAPGDGRGRTAPGATRRQADPALRPAIRQGDVAAGLHQGLRAGHPRERRPVHARRHLGGAGHGVARPRRPSAGTVEPAQPGLPRHHPRGSRALQGRAVRRLRRRLRRSAAHRPRRLDLVHRLGRLAVSRRPGSDSRLPPGGQHAPPRAVRAARLAGVRGHLSPRVRDVPNSGGQPGRRRTAVSGPSPWTVSQCRAASCRSWTTAASTTSGSNWVNAEESSHRRTATVRQTTT